MVCGKCWHTVSGGIVDGDAQHPYYRYGGLWKNHHKKGRIASPEAFQVHKPAPDKLLCVQLKFYHQSAAAGMP